MYIQLIRNKPQGKALFGQLYVDGKSFCDTLENTDYAIPTGFYRLRVTFSPRWQVLLPILDGVIGYRKKPTPTPCPKGEDVREARRTGIRIHAGNTIEHTEGCILVGSIDMGDKAIGRLGDKARLLSSRKALNELREYLLNYMNQNPNEEVYIEISEPDPYPLYDSPCAPELQQHAIDARYELKRQRERRAKECQH